MRKYCLLLLFIPFIGNCQSAGWFWSVENLTVNVGKTLLPGHVVHVKAPAAWYSVVDTVYSTVTIDMALTAGDVVQEIYGVSSQWVTNSPNIYLPSGRIGIRVTNPGATIHTMANGSGAWWSDAYSNTSGNKPNMILRRSGGSDSSPTKLLSGYDLGAFSFYGSYGSGTAVFGAVAQARLIAQAEEDFTSATNLSTRFAFATTPTGGVLTTRMTIKGSGLIGIGTTDPTALVDMNSDIVRLRTAKTPATATATGNAGDICWDANYVYVCIATNTWKRSAITTW